MKMVLRGVIAPILLVVAVLVTSASGVSAISLSLTDVNSSLVTARISSATNLYAYEVALDYTGTVAASDAPFPFLTSDGASSTYGSSTRSSIFKVYESRLDNSDTGISGSGDVFNVTYTGTLTRRYLLAVYADGTQEYVYYNNSGSTTTGGTGGSSGGGSATTSTGSSTPIATAESARFTFSLDELLVGVRIDQATPRSIVITNTGDETLVLNLTSLGLGDAAAFPASLTIPPGESTTLDFVFTTREPKLIVGQIVFSVDRLPVATLPVILNVRSDNFLFDSTLYLAQRYRRLVQGTNLVAQVNLIEVGRVTDQLDVTAHYFIKDFGGSSYLEESETFAVLGAKEYTREFYTETLPPGEYVLGLELVYPGAFATATTQFSVIKRGTFLLYVVGALVLVGVMGTVGVWLWLRTRRSSFPVHAVSRRTRRTK